MRTLALIALVLGLAACQPAGSPLPATAPAPGGVEAFATLAPLGSFEWHAAPAYTRNAALRHRAAALLRGGRITKAQAVEVLRRTDRVRTLLDSAVTLDTGQQPDQAAARLAAARLELDATAALLEDK